MNAAKDIAPTQRPEVLVIDDDEVLRLATRAALTSAGFEVLEAPDGPRGLIAYQRRVPDIILLDIMMPGQDGFSVCREIRAKPGGGEVAIVMLTGLDDRDSIREAYDAGATDFITKPINYLLLSQRVDYLMRAKRTADALRTSQARLGAAQRIARLGHWEWDRRKETRYLSEGLAEFYPSDGHTPADDLARFLACVHPDDRAQIEEILGRALREVTTYSIEHRVILPAGGEGTVHQEGRFSCDENGVLAHGVGTIQDVTERRRSEEQVRLLTYFDELTGLPNREFLRQQLERSIATARRYQRSFAVLLLGLDQFKRFNETLGFKTGDTLLHEVAKRLATVIRTSDTVYRDAKATDPNQIAEQREGTIARLSGDEFVLVLTEIHNPEDAVVVAKRVARSLSDPFPIDGELLYVSACIGITIFPLDGDTADSLLERAEAAMHEAKTQGRGHHNCYSGAVKKRAQRKFLLENELREALRSDALEVYYQPRVDLKRRRVAGMEALARWRHPQLGWIGPDEFIPVAEQSGLIHSLGLWVARTACAQTRAWQKAGLQGLKVAINLSPAQFHDPDLCQSMLEVLDQAELAARWVEFELTESMLLEDADSSLATLTLLRKTDVGIAIDDFGTGYSSLSYLSRYPLTTLKIDRAFIRDVHRTKEAASIASAIIALGHGLGLGVVAEGIEVVEQLRFLEAKDCDEVQGFHFARALPAQEFADWVAAGHVDLATTDRVPQLAHG